MFKGLGDITKIAGMFKNMQSMGGKMEEITERLKVMRVHGSSGGEMVVVEANGLGQFINVTIDSALRNEADWEMIQDLLVAAFNDASVKAKQKHVDAMQELTGGLDLPGLGDALNKFGLGG